MAKNGAIPCFPSPTTCPATSVTASATGLPTTLAATTSSSASWQTDSAYFFLVYLTVSVGL